MSLKVRYSHKHVGRKAKVHARASAPVLVADVRRVSSLEEQASLLSAALASDAENVAQMAGELLSITQQATGSIASALFRNIHDTGLLIPLARGPFGDLAQAERDDVSVLMERAADAAAIGLLKARKKSALGFLVHA